MIENKDLNQLSIIKSSDIIYPDSSEYFSPQQHYPEYPFSEFSSKTNYVYHNIRQCFFQLGLDKIHFGYSTWNPLGNLIKPGSKVFVLCNFVNNPNLFESKRDFFSKCTHGSVLRAVVDYVLIALGKTGEVSFGNAPIQSADFNKILNLTGADRVLDFYKRNERNVKCSDLRLYKIEKHSISGKIKKIIFGNSDDSVDIDLGIYSLLEELYENSDPHFRSIDYDKEKTEKCHTEGKHVYSISKKVLESDIIISLPKIKTHEKVGFSGAIKGCVGAISNKDGLAHFRSGPINKGGDAYENDPIKIYWLISNLNECANRSIPSSIKGILLRIIDINLQRILRKFSVKSLGAWQGNDTCWRMSLDTARIVSHGSSNGMNLIQARTHLVLVDGVIGGENQGPLKTHAVHTGIVLFATNPVLSDYACAILMGYDPRKLPILSNVKEISKFPLTTNLLKDLSYTIIYNGIGMKLTDLKKFCTHKFKPPKGWGRLDE